MSVKHWTLVTAGVAGGIALGVTGYASAAGSPSPAPSHAQKAQRSQVPGSHGFQGDKGRGFGGRGQHGGARGLVTAVSASSITVRTLGGETKTLALNGTTTYYEGQAKATRAAVDLGEIVLLQVADPKAAKPVASRVTVLPAHLLGFVTKIEGSTLTITDESGFTRTITTSSATTYSKDGVAGKASDVTVGALVRALGSVDANGTTLDATHVAVGTPPDRGNGKPQGPGAEPGSNEGPDGPPPGEGVDG